jgi:hypothetical protein
MYVAPGVGLSGAVHLVAKRPYIAGAIAGAILVITLMRPVPVPPTPPVPSVPAFWSQE